MMQGKDMERKKKMLAEWFAWSAAACGCEPTMPTTTNRHRLSAQLGHPPPLSAHSSELFYLYTQKDLPTKALQQKLTLPAYRN
jgi:hypothetical protein